MTEQEWLSSEDPAAMLRCLLDRVYTREEYEQRQLVKVPRPSDRKLRLFACACVRRVWHLLTHRDSQNAVEVAERFADGQVTAAEMEAALRGAYYLTQGTPGDSPQRYAEYLASNVALPDAAQFFRSNYAQWPERAGVPRATQAALLRDIVGNPFRPVTLSPAWLTPQVLTLARAAYEGRAGFSICSAHQTREPGCPRCAVTLRPDDGTLDPLALLALADALEEAGCPQVLPCRFCKGERVVVAGEYRTMKCPCAEIEANPLLAHLRSPGPHVRGCFALDLILGKE